MFNDHAAGLAVERRRGAAVVGMVRHVADLRGRHSRRYYGGLDRGHAEWVRLIVAAADEAQDHFLDGVACDFEACAVVLRGLTAPASPLRLPARRFRRAWEGPSRPADGRDYGGSERGDRRDSHDYRDNSDGRDDSDGRGYRDDRDDSDGRGYRDDRRRDDYNDRDDRRDHDSRDSRDYDDYDGRRDYSDHYDYDGRRDYSDRYDYDHSGRYDHERRR